MGPGKTLGIDLGTSGGRWLVRQDELVLGPFGAESIIERLYTGELDGRSQVQPMGAGAFRPLEEVEFFHVHLAKAEAKLRVERAAQGEALIARRRRNARLALLSALATGLAVSGIFVVRYFAVYQPWRTEPAALVAELISVEPPTITRARRHDEELVEYRGPAVPSPATSPGPQAAPPGARASKPVAQAARRPAGGARVSDPSDDPDGMQVATFDQAAINAVVASRQRTLFPCLAAVAQRRPGFSARVPIEFVIGNDGRVAKVWVDHPDFKTGALPECLLRELRKWPFKPYEGERATVGLSFKLGKG